MIFKIFFDHAIFLISPKLNYIELKLFFLCLLKFSRTLKTLKKNFFDH